jgi:signal transduction histidine kinase
LLTQLYINEHLIALSEKARLMAEQELKQRAILEESRRMEALSRLSGGIAHDFNNTLVVMLGNAEIALMDLDDKSQTRESIEKIIAAGSSASEMTRQLLTIGRKDESAPEFIVLEKLLSRLVSSLTRLMPNHILLEYDISGTPCIFADPVMFERAFINLVLNARDAMPNGGMISVSCWVTDNMVRLAVADEGTGMDEDTLSQIYDPFFTTKGKNGTGLGLAILRAWIATTGGDITASSTLGKGSVFTLTLPLVRSTQDPKLTAIGA